MMSLLRAVLNAFALHGVMDFTGRTENEIVRLLLLSYDAVSVCVLAIDCVVERKKGGYIFMYVHCGNFLGTGLGRVRICMLM